MTAPAIVVTGAAGVLGREVVRALGERGAAVRGLGRGAAPAGFPAAWVRADLLRPDDVRAALLPGEVVVHAASDPFHPGVDVEAAHALARAAGEAGVAHVVFVQIAGIATAARASAYYRDKALAEEVLRRGTVPCSAAAATQFHPLVNRVLTSLSRGPLLLCPRFTLQPVDVGFFAERVAGYALAPDGSGITVRGPETLTSRTMAAAWLAARRRRALVVPGPAVGRLAGFARIERVAGIAGGSTWAEWLARDIGRGRPV